MSKYDTLSDAEIDKLIDDAFGKGWQACLNEIQKVKMEQEANNAKTRKIQ